MAHFLCVFHALSLELNFFLPEFPFKSQSPQTVYPIIVIPLLFLLDFQDL